MRTDFTFVPSVFPAYSERHTRSVPVDAQDRQKPILEAERCGFSGVVIDGGDGPLGNIERADQALRQTISASVCLTHWAGAIAPTVAAEHIARLDLQSGGRLSLRFVVDSDDGGAGGHASAWRRTDEYIVLLKRLLTNERPFDHVGPFYAVEKGFVAAKGPSGHALPLRLRGVSGTALEVAGRHADILELPAMPVGELREVITHARSVAASRGRASRIRFALPVQLGPLAARSGSEDAFVLDIAGTGAISTLHEFVEVGISDFMIVGADDRATMQQFSQRVATPLMQFLGHERPRARLVVSRDKPYWSAPGRA